VAGFKHSFINVNKWLKMSVDLVLNKNHAAWLYLKELIAIKIIVIIAFKFLWVCSSSAD
jgi:hypothetical protein